VVLPVSQVAQPADQVRHVLLAVDRPAGQLRRLEVRPQRGVWRHDRVRPPHRTPVPGGTALDVVAQLVLAPSRLLHRIGPAGPLPRADGPPAVGVQGDPAALDLHADDAGVREHHDQVELVVTLLVGEPGVGQQHRIVVELTAQLLPDIALRVRLERRRLRVAPGGHERSLRWVPHTYQSSVTPTHPRPTTRAGATAYASRAHARPRRRNSTATSSRPPASQAAVSASGPPRSPVPSQASRTPVVTGVSGRKSAIVCIGPVITPGGRPPPPSSHIGMKSNSPRACAERAVDTARPNATPSVSSIAVPSTKAATTPARL